MSELDTPAARWRECGEPDPHGDRFDCQRKDLPMGDLTDDEMANEVFMRPMIGTTQAAKDRIRWLSRRAVNLEATNNQLLEALEEITANHADMVLRNAVLRQRPDLPVDRIPAIKRYEEKVKSSRISGMREMFEWLKSQGLVMNLGYRDGEDFINRQAITNAKQVMGDKG